MFVSVRFAISFGILTSFLNALLQYGRMQIAVTQQKMVTGRVQQTY